MRELKYAQTYYFDSSETLSELLLDMSNGVKTLGDLKTVIGIDITHNFWDDEDHWTATVVAE